MKLRINIASRKSLASVSSPGYVEYGTIISTICAHRLPIWMLHRMYHIDTTGDPSQRIDVTKVLRVWFGSNGAIRNMTSIGRTHVSIASADVLQG